MELTVYFIRSQGKASTPCYAFEELKIVAQ